MYNSISKKMLYFATVSGAALLLAIGCNYQVDKTNGQGGKNFRKLEGVTEFAAVEPIFKAKCTECHVGRSKFDPSVYEASFANMNETKIRLLRTGGGQMPPTTAPQLADGELSLIMSWIESGGKLTKEAPTPDPTPTPVPNPNLGPQPSFAQLTANFLGTKCFSCHDGSDEFTPKLNTYDKFSGVSGTVKDYVKRPIDDSSHMPPSDKPQLSAAELKALIEWIDAGAPENGKP